MTAPITIAFVVANSQYNNVVASIHSVLISRQLKMSESMTEILELSEDEYFSGNPVPFGYDNDLDHQILQLALNIARDCAE
jgi:hypothetical protein